MVALSALSALFALFDRVSQLICAIHGHDYRMHHATERLFLRCADCGSESPGWHVPIRVRAEKAPVPARMMPAPALALAGRRAA